jgi:predicted ATP-grasp superfamily ATP-dependent carboligase
VRVFVWEYCCAACPDAPESLRREGRAMLSAIVSDLARCPSLEAVTLPEKLPAEDEVSAFRQLCRTCDWTLVIAPESDGILLDRCRIVEDEGGRLLGPDSAAVALTGDKLRLGRHLSERGIASPHCELLRQGRGPSLPFPLACKPRDGAGSQGTFLVHTGAELKRAVETARAEGFAGELIVQPFVPGLAASVAFLVGPRGVVALPAAEQCLSDDGRFRYFGGRLPLPPGLDERARRLADRALAAIPGLRGYVGVDLVLGAEQDTVVEINPRLTTSYVGLRQLAQDNLASAMLALAAGGEMPVLRWRSEPVVFGAREA